MARSSIHIQASPQAVFDYVADFSRHGEWASHQLSIEPETPGAVGVGSRYRSHGVQFGRELHDRLTVTAYEPGRRFAFESEGVGGVWRHDYEIRPEDGGVTLVRRMEPKRLHPLLRLISPLFGLGLPRRNQKDLERLRDRLEARG